MKLEATEVTADQLASELDSGSAPMVIVDLRAPPEVQRWKVEGDRDIPRIERPYWDVLGTPDTLAAEIPGGSTAIVICAVGNTSAMVADELRSIGVDARNLQGGMAAWARLHVARTVPGLTGGTYLVQLDRVAKGCLSYVLGLEQGPALVVDPDRYQDDYLDTITDHGSTLTGVIDTHLHADHISGAAMLAAAYGVPYLLVDDIGARRDHRHPGDGELIFGDGAMSARTIALHTPGHTPGSTGIIIGDRFLLSGDTLFVEGVGRPDLGGQIKEWGADLHSTLTQRLARLSDDVLVLPAHYQSRRERHGGIYAARLGDLRRQAEFTQGLDEFLADVVGHTRQAPQEYGRIRKVNLGIEALGDDLLDELEIGKNQCAAGRTDLAATGERRVM